MRLINFNDTGAPEMMEYIGHDCIIMDYNTWYDVMSEYFAYIQQQIDDEDDEHIKISLQNQYTKLEKYSDKIWKAHKGNL